jgi:RNA polymerase sigma-70 factor (ECF subfamily)
VDRPANQPEQEIVSRLRDGESYAFELLYHRYKYQLAANLLKLLKSEELAEEVLQELFIRIWEGRESLDPDKSFPAYLFRIARNMVVDIYRKAARESKVRQQLLLATEEFENSVEDAILDRESNADLYDAIALLPPQRRKVFTLCRIEGKSYKEAGELLGISSSTVNDHLLKANKFLKDQLGSPAGLSMSLLAAAILHGL